MTTHGSRRVRTTSVAAYQAILASGFISRMQREAYRILFLHGPMTGLELSEYGRISGVGSTLFKMLSQLQDLGLVAPIGVTKETPTGFKHLIWDVTDKMPEDRRWRPKTAKAEQIKQLNDEVQNLKVEIERKTAEANAVRDELTQLMARVV